MFLLIPLIFSFASSYPMEMIPSFDTNLTAELYEAIIAADELRIKAFLEKNPSSINSETDFGMTPLMIAVNQGHSSIIKLLISKGANIRAKDHSKASVLDYLFRAQAFECLVCFFEELTDQERDAFIVPYVQTVDKRKGLTLLSSACAHGNVEMVRFLIAKGASVNIVTPQTEARLKDDAPLQLININTTNSAGETPLHEAFVRDNKEGVALLLSHGADPSMRNGEGKTAFELAESVHSEEMISLLHAWKQNNSFRNVWLKRFVFAKIWLCSIVGCCSHRKQRQVKEKKE